MIFQLHWQNRLNLNETKLVAQASSEELGSCEAVVEHFQKIIQERQSECPKDWVPLVCSEGSEYFMFAALAKHEGKGRTT